jgi:hypothetical protein
LRRADNQIPRLEITREYGTFQLSFASRALPKVKTVTLEDVVDEAPWQRLEKSAFYRDIAAQGRK